MKKIKSIDEFYRYVKYLASEVNEACLRFGYIEEIENFIDYKHHKQSEISDNLIRFFDIVMNDLYYRIICIVFNIFQESNSKQNTDIKIDAVFKFYKDYPNKKDLVCNENLIKKAIEKLEYTRETEASNISKLKKFKDKMISHMTIKQQSIDCDIIDDLLKKARNIIDTTYGSVFGSGEQELNLDRFSISNHLEKLKKHTNKHIDV